MNAADRRTIADAVMEVHNWIEADPVTEEDDDRPDLLRALIALLERQGGPPYGMPVWYGLEKGAVPPRSDPPAAAEEELRNLRLGLRVITETPPKYYTKDKMRADAQALLDGRMRFGHPSPHKFAVRKP